MSAEDVLSEVNKMTGNDLARYIKSVGVSRDKFGKLAGLRPSGMNFRIHYRGVDADKPIQNLMSGIGETMSYMASKIGGAKVMADEINLMCRGHNYTDKDMEVFFKNNQLPPVDVMKYIIVMYDDIMGVKRMENEEKEKQKKNESEHELLKWIAYHIIEDKFDKDETLKKLSEAGIVKKVWAVEN